MPELRKDPVVGRWVIIATERARRPGNIVGNQRHVFAENKDDIPTTKAKPLYSSKGVKVVTAAHPLLSPKRKINREHQGFYEVLSGYGYHETVIETAKDESNMADLSEAQIVNVIRAYVERINEIRKDSDIEYILIYKKYAATDAEMGVPSSSHILAAPVVPLHIKEKIIGSEWYYKFHERCVYSDILRQEAEDKRRIVAENKDYVALMPFASRFPFETWIMPRKQHFDFAQGVKGSEKALASILKEILLKIKVGLGDPAYTFVINTTPLSAGGRNGNQRFKEDFCWHIEITPRLTRDAGFEKGSGFYICSIPPEETAEFLRTAEISER